MHDSRAPHGARGLKFAGQYGSRSDFRRAPHGARGLKLREDAIRALCKRSRPTRGAWIEIAWTGKGTPGNASRPTRGAWIEISPCALCVQGWQSRPTRGAWIEITDILRITLLQIIVAPHTGRVD